MMLWEPKCEGMSQESDTKRAAGSPCMTDVVISTAPWHRRIEVTRSTHPVIRVHAGSCGPNIRRYRAVVARPEPDPHERARALHRVVSSPGGVERPAVAVRCCRLHSAALVAIHVGVAVGGDDGSSHGPASCGLDAVGACMQRHLVGFDVVGTLQLHDVGGERLGLFACNFGEGSTYDINLTLGRPTGLIDLPGRGPSGTPLRHVPDVVSAELFSITILRAREGVHTQRHACCTRCYS